MEELKQIEDILARHVTEREELLPVLQEIQEKMGYLSAEAMEQVAHFFNLPKAEIYGVVTFYKKFRRKPAGKYPIEVCQGTACYLLGGNFILDALSRELQIKSGDTTDDHTYSLNTASCFGCCNAAPVVKLNSEVYSRMTPGKVDELLINLRARETDKKVGA